MTMLWSMGEADPVRLYMFDTAARHLPFEAQQRKINMGNKKEPVKQNGVQQTTQTPSNFH